MARDPKAAEAFLARAEDSGFDVDGYLRANKLERPIQLSPSEAR